jgi:hypothetical protein
MSTPVRGPDGPLGYAPRWARGDGIGHAETGVDLRVPRGSAPIQELTLPEDYNPPHAATSSRESGSARDTVTERELVSSWDTSLHRGAAAERGAPPARESAPHWDSQLSRDSDAAQASAVESVRKRKKRQPVFEGDAALRELRSRLASAPDQTPEPPLYQTKTPMFAAVARLLGIMVLAAVGALGFLWVTAPHGAPSGQVASQPKGEVALVSYRGLEAPKPAVATENGLAERVPDAPSSGAPWAVANYSRNTTDGVGTPPAAVTPRAPAVPRATVTRVTAPPPTPPAPAAVPPPVAAPVPASKTAVPSISAPVSPLLPPASPVAATDRDEIAALLARARTYLSAGDVAAARLVLRRAAEHDDPQAALALGGTYDPTVLKRLGIINFHADPTQAREWYRKAADLGSPDASLRLDQLVQSDR